MLPHTIRVVFVFRMPSYNLRVLLGRANAVCNCKTSGTCTSSPPQRLIDPVTTSTLPCSEHAVS